MRPQSSSICKKMLAQSTLCNPKDFALCTEMHEIEAGLSCFVLQFFRFIRLHVRDLGIIGPARPRVLISLIFGRITERTDL